MKVEKIIDGIKVKKCVNFDEKTLKIDIKTLCDNTKSKKIANSLFVCIEGFNFDSHNLASKFEVLGVKFVVCEKEIDTNLPYIIVESTRSALSKLCDNFYNHPTKSFKLIGVIGTNGKTSTTYFIKQFIEKNNKKCSVIGTSGVYINNKKLKETLTTPDPLVLYKLFDKAKKAKSDVVVMEISAHAISLKKVENLKCDIVCFTNFSQDHLDFFKTMENYKQTKFSFFNALNTKKAIINIDCIEGEELYSIIYGKIDAKTFSLQKKADFCAKNVKTTLQKSVFELIFEGFCKKVEVFVPCLFNVYNILCAISVCKELGFVVNQKILSSIKPVKGRFDVFCLKDNKYIIIDYAHTPESLKTVFLSIKSLGNNKIIALFGCPGNRDETKREIMGKIAKDFCEKVIITSDNPKFENPLIICEEILWGAKGKGIIIEDREKAIDFAIKNLKPNEVLCIIGKGTEEYQDINNKKIKYSDYFVVSKRIKNL